MVLNGPVSSPRGRHKRVSSVSQFVNKNTNWMDNYAFWWFYVLLILLAWMVVSSWTDPGMGWTYVHIAHGLITYFLFHWNKGSAIETDQGKYDR